MPARGKNPHFRRICRKRDRSSGAEQSLRFFVHSSRQRKSHLSHRLKFRRLSSVYAIVRLDPQTSIPDWATKADFTSISRTPDELSIVCPGDNLPADVHSSHRWICLKLEGPFAFSLTGILLSFIEPLSSNGIPIFAISTYDTDYVLIQEEFAGAALEVLQNAGHELLS